MIKYILSLIGIILIANSVGLAIAYELFKFPDKKLIGCIIALMYIIGCFFLGPGYWMLLNDSDKQIISQEEKDYKDVDEYVS